MNLYRGLSDPVWADRLKAAGWPDVAALQAENERLTKERDDWKATATEMAEKVAALSRGLKK